MPEGGSASGLAEAEGGDPALPVESLPGSKPTSASAKLSSPHPRPSPAQKRTSSALAGAGLVHRRLESLMLLHRQDLLNPTPQGRRRRHHLTLESLELPESFAPIHLSGSDLRPEGSDLLGQGRYVRIHGGLQLLDLGQLVSREPQSLLVLDDDIQGLSCVRACPLSPEPGTPLTLNGCDSQTHRQRQGHNQPTARPLHRSLPLSIRGESVGSPGVPPQNLPGGSAAHRPGGPVNLVPLSGPTLWTPVRPKR